MTNLKSTRWGRYPEAALLFVGVTLLAMYGTVRIYNRASSRAALREFAEASSKAVNLVPPDVPQAREEVDFSLWSEKRIAAYRQSLGLKSDGPVAVLSIPSLRLEVPVFEGTDELNLNRGVGRIVGTAGVGQPGNIGIAGHRDGFFRCLRDIRIGDRIEVATLGGKTAYAVESTEIVAPDTVSVLQPRDRPALTLVTCYPFYFVGDAPQRFIVHALIVESDQIKVAADAQSNPKAVAAGVRNAPK